MRILLLFLFFIMVAQSASGSEMDTLLPSREADELAEEIVAVLQGLSTDHSNWQADSTYIHYGESFKSRPFSAAGEAQANKDLRLLDSLGKKTIFFYTLKWMDNDQPTKKEHMEAFNKMFAKRLEEVKKAVYKKMGAISVNVLIGMKVYVKERGQKTTDHWQWELNLDKFLLSASLNDSCAKEIDSNLKNIVKNKSYANFKYSVNADKALQYRTKILVTLLKGCKGSNKFISEADYIDAARALNVEVSAIKAFALVESAGSGYLKSGKIKILFEGHKFYKHLDKNGLDPEQLRAGNEDIIYTYAELQKMKPKPFKGGAGEYIRMNKAKLINEEAALQSASYGIFQILGENFRECGYSNVFEFVSDMEASAKKQLDAFINYSKARGIVKPLQDKNWAEVARLYNGKNYKDYNYDKKFEAAYDEFNK